VLVILFSDGSMDGRGNKDQQQQDSRLKHVARGNIHLGSGVLVKSCPLKRIGGKRGMENVIKYMEDSPNQSFLLEARGLERKNESI